MKELTPIAKYTIRCINSGLKGLKRRELWIYRTTFKKIINLRTKIFLSII
jgi:hypothetical protein